SHSPRWDRGSVRVRDLLSHSSGLPDWRPYYLEIELGTRGASACVVDPQARARVIRAVTAEPLVYQPGTRSLYSDLGFILLGRIVELVTGQSLEAFARDTLFEPLGFEATGFVPSSRADQPPAAPTVGDVAPCGLCPWRGMVVRGQVQDENAWAMGGVAGHAGLFSVAREVHLLVLEHLRALRGKSAILEGEFVELAWRRRRDDPRRTWALGWDTPSAQGSTGGGLISRDSVGHLGYTGCSLWVDRARGVHVVLLTNRVHPHPKNRAIARLRPLLHDAVFGVIDAAVGRGEPYARAGETTRV
ncbi:MAG: serine hydrolase domain-containing protein, partial [Candidatus Binatia bacterium]